ncbi:hypothetical protein ACFWHV_30650 [Streptomyces collinus]|uniref:hypothetical protein n=1 Tax=Streptomyces collinus TaxID=42684 RepID=UPI0036606E71
MDHLTTAQEQTGSKALTVFQHRYGAAAVRLRRLARSGALGRPLVATCETLWYRTDAYFEVPWRGVGTSREVARPWDTASISST